MSSIFKRISSFGLVGLFVSTLIVGMFIGNVAPPKAAAASPYELFCIPPTTKGPDGYTPNAWLSLQVINRGLIKVVVTPAGNCANQNRGMESLLGESPGQFKALLDTTLKIGENSDFRGWSYGDPINGDGDGSRDQTILKSLDEGKINNATKDPFGGFNNAVANITTVFPEWSKKSQISFGYELDQVSNAMGDYLKSTDTGKRIVLELSNLGCADNDGGNLALFDEGGVHWGCTSRTGDRKGIIAGGTFTNIENFNITMNVSSDGQTLTSVMRNEGTLSGVGYTAYNFKWCGAENFTQPNGEKGRFRSDCSNTTSGLYLEGPNASPKALQAGSSNSLIGLTVKREGDASGASFTTYAAGSQSPSVVLGAEGADGGLGLAATGDQHIECETSGNNLSWIICPIVNGSLDGAQAIFTSFVQPYLAETPISTEAGSNNPIFTIWRAFRTLGNVVLIFALLFIVFGQSIGGGIVDAYTAKKTIPRILVAAILINLSIYICAILVDVFNVLGAGLVRLIISPLKDSGLFKIRPSGTASNFLGIGAIFGLVVGGVLFKHIIKGQSTNGQGGLGAILGYVLVFVVLPIIIAMLAIFITLLIRRALILMLIIISPIALALFAVPNADKYAKKWIDAFIKTLMVYPIITGIFGIAQVLAVITYASGGGDSATAQLVTLIATLIIAFAPLFMIPFAFKLAGGVIGGLANTVKTGRDNLKKVWGDDKANPYSARNRMKQSVGHGVKGRLISGAGGANNRLLERMSSRGGALDSGRIGAASGKAVKDTDSFIQRENARGNIINAEEAEAMKLAASRAAAASATIRQAPKGSNEQAAEAARAAALAMSRGTHSSGRNYTKEEIQSGSAAAGSASISASRAGFGDPAETSRAASEALSAHLEGRSADEVQAVGLAAAQLHRSSGGRATADQYQASKDAVVKSVQESKVRGGPNETNLKRKNVARYAGAAAGSALGTGSYADPAAKARATAAGDAVANTVGRAHDIGIQTTLPDGSHYSAEKRERAEQAAYANTYNPLSAAPGAPAVPNEGAGDAAAAAAYAAP